MKPVALFILLAIPCLYSWNASAASMQSQLEAVAQAENEGKAQEKLEEDARRERWHQRITAERQRRERAAAAVAARESQRLAAQSALRAKREADKAADKKRDQSYEDQLRAVELENKRLELQAKATRVKRENDFVDQDLKERAARTDVIQSEADARRNITSGSKELLQSEGKAREKKASSWW